MSTRTDRLRRDAGVSTFVAALILVACAAPPPEPLVTESRDEVTATVTAVYPDTRLVSLLTDDGRPLTLYADEDVRNLENVEVGDRVTALYYEAVVAEVTDAPPGAEEPVVVGAQAEEGGKPGLSRGRLYTAVVTVESVDRARSRVRFSSPEGWPTEVTALRPEVQEFVGRLEPGDRVMVTYNRAEALSLTPAE